MKIYLDMDGVLTDFNKEYEKMFGERPQGVVARSKHFYNNWDEFVTSKAFTRLEKHEFADELLNFVRGLKVPVEILSSSGGEKYHDLVVSHKSEWLKANGIDYKANIVPGGAKKAQFAHPWNVLVDDTEHVVDSYRKAGGTAVLHKEIGDTLAQLSDLYLEWQGG
jgi:PAS domain-containing protein